MSNKRMTKAQHWLLAEEEKDGWFYPFKNPKSQRSYAVMLRNGWLEDVTAGGSILTYRITKAGREALADFHRREFAATLEAACGAYPDYPEDIRHAEENQLQAENAALKVRIERLEAALLPFAGTYEDWLTREKVSVPFHWWLAQHINQYQSATLRQWFEQAHNVFEMPEDNE